MFEAAYLECSISNSGREKGLTTVNKEELEEIVRVQSRVSKRSIDGQLHLMRYKPTPKSLSTVVEATDVVDGEKRDPWPKSKNCSEPAEKRIPGKSSLWLSVRRCIPDRNARNPDLAFRRDLLGRLCIQRTERWEPRDPGK